MHGALEHPPTLVRQAACARAALWAGGAVVLACLGACKPAPLPGEPGAPDSVQEARTGGMEAVRNLELAAVGGRVLTLDRFEQRLQWLSPEAVDLFSASDRKAQAFEQLLTMDALAWAAEQDGWLDTNLEAVLVREAAARAAWEAALATQEAIELPDFQNDPVWALRLDELERPERRRLRVIIAPDAETGLQWRAQIEAELAERLDQPDAVVAWWARRFGVDDAVKEQGGDIGWVQQIEGTEGATLHPGLVAAAFATEANQLAGPVETGRGHELVFVSRVQLAQDFTLESATSLLTDLHLQETRGQQHAALLAAWRDELSVSVDVAAVERLALARAAVDPTAPAAPVRPRRYEADALSRSNTRALGYVGAASLDGVPRALTNPLASPAVVEVPAPEPIVEGSGELP